MKKIVLFSVLLFSFCNINMFAQRGVPFYGGSYDDMIREAKKEKKHIILDFYADWCKSCRRLDIETFSNSTLASNLQERFIFYKINVDFFDGMDIADKYNIDAYPTLVILNSKAGYIGRMKGFFAPNSFIEELEFRIKNPEKRTFSQWSRKTKNQAYAYQPNPYLSWTSAYLVYY